MNKGCESLQWPLWNEKSISNGVISFELLDDIGSELCTISSPMVTVMSAQDRQQMLLLPFSNLLTFFDTHRGCQFIARDVATMHWKYVNACEAIANSKLLERLWDLSRQGNFHDVLLLEQRLRHAECGVFPKPHLLETIARKYNVSDTGGSPESHHRQILEIYEKQCERARLIASETSSEAIIEDFGPLGHAIDVQGAIAVSNPDRELRLDVAKLKDLEVRLEAIYAASSHDLKSDRNARKVFQWDDDVVQLDEESRPCYRPAKLRQWLASLIPTLPDINGQNLTAPLDDRGQISLIPEHWGLHVYSTDSLRAWRDVVCSARLKRFFRSGDRRSIQPKYHVAPRIGTSEPELSYLHQSAPGLFLAPDGMRFVKVYVADIEFICLGVICDQFAQEGQITKAFRDRENLLENVVKKLFSQRERSEDESNFRLPQFESDQQFHVAMILLKCVYLGFSIEQVGQLLRYETGQSNLSMAEIGRLFNFFKDRTCPEIGANIRDRTVRHLARNLNIPPESLDEAMRNPGTLEQRIRNLVNTNAQGEAHTNQLKESLQHRSVTPFGRIGPRVSINQAFSLEVQELADEVLKMLLFELSAAGFLIAAVDEAKEFVIPVKKTESTETVSAKIRNALIACVRRLAYAHGGVLIDVPINPHVEFVHDW